jgi:hypothetical protein
MRSKNKSGPGLTPPLPLLPTDPSLGYHSKETMPELLQKILKIFRRLKAQMSS